MRKDIMTRILLAVLLAASLPIMAGNGAKKISPDLFGIFFEDINYSADGGLYAELVQNRSFEYSPTEQTAWNPLTSWSYQCPGYSIGKLSVETARPLHPNNPHYVTLTVEHVGDYDGYRDLTGVGLRNEGFDGIVVRRGDTYNLSFFGRSEEGNAISVRALLQDRKGTILAERQFSVGSRDWQQYEGALVPSASCDSATIMLLATTRGRLSLDMISLFPENTFKHRRNGLRADLAQALADMHPRFVRFPGGCLVHGGDGLGNMYRWKQTVGPVETRPEQKNCWGYNQTAGLGYYEYFQLCEDIGAKPLPIVAAGVSCQNAGGTWQIGGCGQQLIPMDEMPAYIQEVLDLIEWANGPADSPWGSVRAAAGHPEPFGLEYLGVGNEDKITPGFEERFHLIYEAVRAKYPDIVVVGTVGPAPSGEDYDRGWAFARQERVPVVDEHYYEGPDWFLANLHRYDSYSRRDPQVYIGEYASWGNSLMNAVAEALYMTHLERNGDVVRMASYAPLFAKRGHTQWSTDLIYFDNRDVYPSANYYVQQLFAANQGDTYYNWERLVSFDRRKDERLGASVTTDSRTGDVIVKLVNASDAPSRATLRLARFGQLQPTATLTVLTGQPTDENTYEQKDKVVPRTTTVATSKTMTCDVPATSLTVIRIRTK